MRKLLSANFARLWKDKSFWITLAAVFALSLVSILQNAQSAAALLKNGVANALDLERYYFNQVPFIGVICAVFTALFLGTEYDCGAMRNKLIVGHSRRFVYLANLTVSAAAGLLFLAAGVLGGLPGLFLIGPFSFGLTGFLEYLLVAVGFTVAFCALFTLTASLMDTKTSALLLSLFVWLAILIAASGLDDRLAEPEFQSGSMLVDGRLQILDPERNPLYLSGTARTVCACLLDLLPTGQAIRMSHAELTDPLRPFLFSILLAVLLTLLGTAAFRRKNIR